MRDPTVVAPQSTIVFTPGHTLPETMRELEEALRKIIASAHPEAHGGLGRLAQIFLDAFPDRALAVTKFIDYHCNNPEGIIPPEVIRLCNAKMEALQDVSVPPTTN
jgi:hypothetical protein